MMGKEQRYQFSRGGGYEGPRTGLEVFREEKNFLHLPGLKPGIAEPIIPLRYSGSNM